MGVTQCGPVAA